jgi:hypothetical protein
MRLSGDTKTTEEKILILLPPCAVKALVMISLPSSRTSVSALILILPSSVILLVLPAADISL